MTHRLELVKRILDMERQYTKRTPLKKMTICLHQFFSPIAQSLPNFLHVSSELKFYLLNCPLFEIKSSRHTLMF